MGRIARRKLARRGQAVRLTQGRAQALPFPDAAFDAIVATFPAPFITEADTLRECARVLVPGGRFIIVPSAAFTGGGLLRRILEFAYRVTGQQTGRADADADLHGALARLDGFATRLLGLHGFTVQVHHKVFPRSIAFVIVAEKQPSQTPDMVAIAQSVRASDCGSEGRGFKSV
jgi:SAM-dependent methyltransferase